mmetsp:Transcript_122762/g.297952  ORF Transcript_122762/g.297952 Transcript_122762/m.297952 type:complete len:92 (-) Transcript_122762:35-310(-)
MLECFHAWMRVCAPVPMCRCMADGLFSLPEHLGWRVFGRFLSEVLFPACVLVLFTTSVQAAHHKRGNERSRNGLDKRGSCLLQPPFNNLLA